MSETIIQRRYRKDRERIKAKLATMPSGEHRDRIEDVSRILWGCAASKFRTDQTKADLLASVEAASLSCQQSAPVEIARLWSPKAAGAED